MDKPENLYTPLEHVFSCTNSVLIRKRFWRIVVYLLYESWHANPNSFCEKIACRKMNMDVAFLLCESWCVFSNFLNPKIASHKMNMDIVSHRTSMKSIYQVMTRNERIRWHTRCSIFEMNWNVSTSAWYIHSLLVVGLVLRFFESCPHWARNCMLELWFVCHNVLKHRCGSFGQWAKRMKLSWAILSIQRLTKRFAQWNSAWVRNRINLRVLGIF